MMEFIATNFVPLMALCILVFIAGITLLIVGKLIQRHGNKKLRYHLARMTEEDRQAFLIEHGYFDIR